MGRTWLCPSPGKASTKLHETLALSQCHLWVPWTQSEHGLGSPRESVSKGAIGCVLQIGSWRSVLMLLDSSRGLEMASSEGQLLPV